jgi:hypothetical protein
VKRLALALALAAGCGPSRPVAPEAMLAVVEQDDLADIPGRAPSPAERRAIADLLSIAEDVRGLRFARPVPFRIQSRDVITQFVRDQIEDEELERSRVFYVALGLLDPALDIRDLLVRVLGEQIVGYYDHERGLMVIRDDVAGQLRAGGPPDRDLDEAEMVIVHELVHALQDQRLELGVHYEEERTVDADNAFAALVEGDATLAMIGHLAARNGRALTALTRNPTIMRTLAQSSGGGDGTAEMDRAPPIVRLPLLSRYVDGLVFCATLHGGSGWRGVDRAHRAPPTTTEQVLHPDRYLNAEAAVAITLPPLPALEAAGWTPHDEDTLGELEMGIYFGLGQGIDRDAAAAEGWGGDRLRVYRNPSGETAVVWFTAWDDEREAREAALAARATAERSAHPERARVEQVGRSLLLVRDLPLELHPSVESAFSEALFSGGAAAF